MMVVTLSHDEHHIIIVVEILLSSIFVKPEFCTVEQKSSFRLTITLFSSERLSDCPDGDNFINFLCLLICQSKFVETKVIRSAAV